MEERIKYVRGTATGVSVGLLRYPLARAMCEHKLRTIHAQQKEANIVPSPANLHNVRGQTGTTDSLVRLFGVKVLEASFANGWFDRGLWAAKDRENFERCTQAQ